MVLFFALFQALNFSARLRKCFAHLGHARVFGLARVVLQLVVHVVLGFRRLRDRDYYADDPLVCRMLGVTRLPDVATISRTLASADPLAVENLRELLRSLVLDRLEKLRLNRVTIDFVEGSIAKVRKRLPKAVLEVRLDSAFFHENILQMLESRRIEYAAAVPFARFVGLRHLVDSRQRWLTIDDGWSFFETAWRPKSWSENRRIIVIRRKHPVRRKGPLQLDLFEPVDHDFQYKVVVTNKRVGAASILKFFNGRGIHEQLFGEGKQHACLDYVPSRRLIPNQLYVVSTMLAHNLSRELQIRAEPTGRRTTPTRSGFFVVRTLGTLRDQLVRRAGALSRPAGRLTLTLTVAAPKPARDELDKILHRLQAA